MVENEKMPDAGRPNRGHTDRGHTDRGHTDLWEVFTQPQSGAPFEHAGSVHGADAELALQNARDLYTRRGEARCIWVVPAGAIVSSQPEDAESFFDPADDKIYRHPQFYKVPRGVKGL